MRRRSRPLAIALVGTTLSALAVVMPAPPAAAAPIETVTVPANDSDGVSSSTSLVAGTTYVLNAKGTASYGLNNGQNDVECSTLPPDPTWQRSRYILLDPQSDILDVLVNGQSVEWKAKTADAFGCDSTSHQYSLTFTPSANGPVTFKVNETNPGAYQDNNGGFFIDISAAAETQVDSFNVPAGSAGGVNSTASLDPTRYYRIEASGTATYDNNGSQTDAECTTFPPDPTWNPNRWLVLDTQEDLTDLYVGNKNMAWQPKTADLLGCDSTNHVYNVIFQPANAGQVNFRIKDTFNGDNGGFLSVKIFRLEYTPDQPAGLVSPPEISLTETLNVNSADPNGANTVFRQGDSTLLEVNGTFTYGDGTADARCSMKTGDPTFEPSEDNYPTLPPGTVQLVINGNPAAWTPTAPDGGEPSCNSTNHTYRLIYMPASSGIVNFKVSDNNYIDNGGVLTVKVFRIREIPAGRVSVNSASPSGAMTPPLIQGRRYRLFATGTYGYYQNVPGTQADAECSQAGFLAPTITDPDPFQFKRNRFGTGDGDLLDVLLNDHGLDWATSGGSTTACDGDHAYEVMHQATSPNPLTLRVADPNPGDNSGAITVDLFLQSS